VSRVRLSSWAHTDRYYPQPFLTELYTCVREDGSWSFFTHGGKRTIVLLVDDTYVGPAGPPPLPASIDHHPATDRGVLAWAELPPSRTLRFAGETWWVKESEPHTTDPGPCVFSADPASVFVDHDGLHLRTRTHGNTWTCAEVVLDRARGYGAYTFQVASALDTLDARIVFGGFLFESLAREIDVECSPALTGAPNGCQYVVQPFDRPGNRRIFPIPGGPTTHRISWQVDRIEFLSWRGVQPFPPDPQDVIDSFVYTGPDIPPAGNDRMRFNLWLSGGTSPAGGAASEVVIRSFDYTCPPQGCAGTRIVAAVLPLSRSNQVGTTVTAFASVINAGSNYAIHCRVSPPAAPSPGLGLIEYRETDPVSNLSIGALNAPVAIAPGKHQTFVFAFTPVAAIPETALPLRFHCDNAPDAPSTAGVNDFVIVADPAPVPDTIAVIGTPSRDGVVRIPGQAGVQAFVIGTANVGATGNIVVTADTGAVRLPLTLTVCETDAAGACLMPPAASVTVHYIAGATHSFAFFASASGSIAFDPAIHRIFARLKQNGVTRGLTSAAVCTTPNSAC
jgi:hypothetical protein